MCAYCPTQVADDTKSDRDRLLGIMIAALNVLGVGPSRDLTARFCAEYI